MIIRRAALCLWLGAFLPCLASAQTAVPRPLVTQDLATVGRHAFAVHLGASYEKDALPAPLLGGPAGDHVQFPLAGFAWGLGDRAQLEVEWPVFQEFDAAGGSSGVGDVHLWTKVAFPAGNGSRPDLGFRFGLKVPNASDEDGLGTDEADVFGAFLLQKRMGTSLLLLNVGLGILGDPLRNGEQVDVYTYGLAVEAALWGRTVLVGELAGYSDPSSVGVTRDRGEARVGFRLQRGRGAFCAALLAGYDEASPDWGLVVGYTWLPVAD